MLAVIADDLTGALDTGIQFRKQGFSTRVVLPPFPPGSLEQADAEVLVVDLETRHSGAAEASARVAECAQRLLAAGARQFYKKIDSTLRGPWAEELAALRRTVGAGQAVVCPAFPAVGRRVREGQVYVAGAPLAGERPAAALTRAGERLASREEGQIVPGGRPGMVLADAETDKDLDALIEWATARGLDRVLCGSGGLAGAWARALRPAGFIDSPPSRPCRRILVAAGSPHPATLAQVEILARLPGTSFRPEQPLAGSAFALILTSGAAPGEVAEPASIAKGLAARAAKLHTEQPFDGWVLTGGETAYHLLQALGAEGVRLESEALPGIPVSVIEGGAAGGGRVVTKSGGFGEPDALARLVEGLRSPT